MDEKIYPNTIQFDDKAATMTIVLDLRNVPAMCLGSLDISKDAVKNYYMRQALKKKGQDGLIVPPSNGKGDLHVLS